MENENKQVEWHKFKESWVGLLGEQVVAILDATEDTPCEMFQISQMAGCYITIEAAKQATEEGIRQSQQQHQASRKSSSEFYLALLNSAMASFEAMYSKDGANPAQEPHAGGDKK